MKHFHVKNFDTPFPLHPSPLTSYYSACTCILCEHPKPRGSVTRTNASIPTPSAS